MRYHAPFGATAATVLTMERAARFVSGRRAEATPLMLSVEHRLSMAELSCERGRRRSAQPGGIIKSLGFGRRFRVFHSWLVGIAHADRDALACEEYTHLQSSNACTRARTCREPRA